MPYRSYRPRRATRAATKSSPPLKGKVSLLRRRRKPRSMGQVNKMLNRLKSAVNKNTMRTYGEIQMRRDQYTSVFPDQRDSIYDLSAEQPVILCHQSARASAAMWQCRYDSVAGSLSVAQCGSFPQQISPAESVAAVYKKYDTLQFWANSENVQPKFLLKHVDYQFNMTFKGVEGYIQLLLITPRRIWPAHAVGPGAIQTEFQLPYSLPGWMNTCVFSQNQYTANPQYYTQKVLKTHYFNCLPRSASGPTYIQSQPTKCWNVRVKSNAIISVADANDAAQVYDWTDIAAGKKSFLMLRTSVPQSSVTYTDPNARIACDIFKQTVWRDNLGNSGA